MFEALLTSTGLALGLAIGFVIAWARGGRTREQLAALQARAEEQEKAAEDKLALVANTQAALANQFKALSAEALDSTSHTFLQLATTQLGQFQERAQSDLKERQQAVDALVQPIKESLTKVDGKLARSSARASTPTSLDEQLRTSSETAIPLVQKATTSLANAMRQPP